MAIHSWKAQEKMVFSSLTFLFLFLPLTLFVYSFCREKYRNLWLLFMSLVFYGYGEPRYLLLLIASILINYLCGRALTRQADAQPVGSGEPYSDLPAAAAPAGSGMPPSDPAGLGQTFFQTAHKDVDKSAVISLAHGCPRQVKHSKKIVLAAGVSVNLALLAFFKYLGLAAGVISYIAKILSGSGISISEPALPIGISFFTFQGLSYIVDVYRGKTKAQKNLIDFAMYIALFPQLIAGPIVRYTDIEKDLHHREAGPDQRSAGMERFILGLGKKILIANICGELAVRFSDMSFAGRTTISLAWLSAIAYMLQIYFDFSAYSDMAIGIGSMLGFHFPENFRYPYTAVSITDFWTRWHMTLSSFFKEYVYIPLGGNRRGIARQILNLLIVWTLTGLWHGAGVQFVLWGLYYFLFLSVEKVWGVWRAGRLSKNRISESSVSGFGNRVSGREKTCLPVRIICRFYTHLVVLFGWVIFSAGSWERLLAQIKAMFGIGVRFMDTASIFYLEEYLPVIIVFILISTGLPFRYYRRWSTRTRLPVCMVVFTLSIAFLIQGSYNPFLYFRF